MRTLLNSLEEHSCDAGKVLQSGQKELDAPGEKNPPLEISHHRSHKIIPYCEWAAAYFRPWTMSFSVEKRKTFYHGEVLIGATSISISSSHTLSWFSWPTTRALLIDCCLVPIYEKGMELGISEDPLSERPSLNIGDIEKIRKSMARPLKQGDYTFDKLSRRDAAK